MKAHALFAAVVVLILLGAVGGVMYFGDTAPVSTPTPTATPPLPTPIPGIQLYVQNLTVWTNGTVSFAVTLYEYDAGILETVSVNNTRYSWANGSTENTTILKGETKTWRRDIGFFHEGEVVHVVVEAAPEWGSSYAVAKSPSTDGNKPNDGNLVYDYYGGVGLFEKGIHIIATRRNPLTFMEESQIANDYWRQLKENETVNASYEDFISIIISRGDHPTGGYTINVESFSWLESYPVKFRFHVNFTDPGEGVIVTEALTNPLVLVPIGRLSPGDYEVEVHIVQYILTFDEQGNPTYRVVQTFKEEVWKQTFTIFGSNVPSPSNGTTTFRAVVNGMWDTNIQVQVDISNGLTKEEAEMIAETTFIQVKGDEVMRRLDALTFDDRQIQAHYTWGIDESDMGHVFDMTADLTILQITVTHCR